MGLCVRSKGVRASADGWEPVHAYGAQEAEARCIGGTGGCQPRLKQVSRMHFPKAGGGQKSQQGAGQDGAKPRQLHLQLLRCCLLFLQLAGRGCKRAGFSTAGSSRLADGSARPWSPEWTAFTACTQRHRAPQQPINLISKADRSVLREAGSAADT